MPTPTPSSAEHANADATGGNTNAEKSLDDSNDGRFDEFIPEKPEKMTAGSQECLDCTPETEVPQPEPCWPKPSSPTVAQPAAAASASQSSDGASHRAALRRGGTQLCLGTQSSPGTLPCRPRSNPGTLPCSPRSNPGTPSIDLTFYTYTPPSSTRKRQRPCPDGIDAPTQPEAQAEVPAQPEVVPGTVWTEVPDSQPVDDEDYAAYAELDSLCVDSQFPQEDPVPEPVLVQDFYGNSHPLDGTNLVTSQPLETSSLLLMQSQDSQWRRVGSRVTEKSSGQIELCKFWEVSGNSSSAHDAVVVRTQFEAAETPGSRHSPTVPETASGPAESARP